MRRWILWLLLAPGALAGISLLAILPNPVGRWQQTLGVVDRLSPALTRRRALPPQRRAVSYLDLRLKPKGPKGRGAVVLRILSGAAAPRWRHEVDARTVEAARVPVRELWQDRFLRWELGQRVDFSRPLFLLVSLDRSTDQATQTGYDRVRILPGTGRGAFRLGHLHLHQPLAAK